ncbi:hypothetical protein HDV03_005342 [Kappamyces sp. JEL0829]|nr:hypothetical protein HDV03_005342 [Kappamyces sp. JEL0829]
MRADTAFLLPSGLAIGLGLYEVVTCVFLLANVPNKRTVIFFLSCMTLFFIFGICLTDFLFLDYSASPYMVPNWYLGTIGMACYLVNSLSTIGITILFLYRIKTFYGFSSNVFRSLAVLGLLVVLTKGSGDLIMGKTMYDFSRDIKNVTTLNPLYKPGAFVLAAATALEALFTTCGSVSFLLYLTNMGSAETGGWNEVREQVFKKEGVRLTILSATHLIIAYFGIWVAIQDGYVAHVGFFLPAFAYALEMHTFLLLSYKTSRKVLGQIQTYMQSHSNRSNQKSATTPKRYDAKFFDSAGTYRKNSESN